MEGAKHGAAGVGAFLLEQAENLAGELGIQTRNGFIGEDTLWFADQGTGDCNALALPAGYVGDSFLCEVADAEFFEKFHGAAPVRAWESEKCAPSRTLPKEAAEDICLGGGIWRKAEVLKNEAQPAAESLWRVFTVFLATVGDLSGCRLKHSGEAGKEGGLAGAGSSLDRNEGAPLYIEIETVEQRTAFPLHGEIFNPKMRRRCFHSTGWSLWQKRGRPPRVGGGSLHRPRQVSKRKRCRGERDFFPRNPAGLCEVLDRPQG